jgi:hypothetical protein
VRKFTPVSAPSLLLCAIKRFLPSGVKLSGPISVPDVVTLAGCDFVVRSMVVHHGGEVGGGHYTARLEQFVANDDSVDSAPRGWSPYPYLVLLEPR